MKKIFLILLTLSLIACSSDVDVPDEQVPTTSSNVESEESTNTTLVNTPEENNSVVEEYIFNIERMSALTGLEIAPELWLKRPRRVLAFKIDNNINARPQSGLQEADAVFELLVEGGMTRFLAFFHDKSSTYLGPVRSARPTDPTVIRPYGGTLVVSGATGGLIPTIRESGVPVLEETGAPAMFRISNRNAPHNLYADTELVRDVITDKGYYFLQPGPKPLYSFGNDQTNWNQGAARVTIKYSEFTTVIWKLGESSYERFIVDGYAPNKEAVAHNFITQDGNYTDILKTQTVVVIQGPLYNDENTTLPSILTVGVGPVTVFNDGNVIEGTWRRNDINEPFTFTDTEQNIIQVPPSSQWVHIVPTDGEITWSES
ncbi:DUF3048 domain-containing protein [Candidatus Actinomarina sp.]|nr:DUF3048 domain-containing protein [Candidatus Actinomarina sp.]